jgi:hypothetical protein
VGSGNASEAAAGRTVISRRRTSQNMMLNDRLTTKYPKMARFVENLHTKALSLLAAGALTSLQDHSLAT